jgi:flavin-dependent thymidylate synthase
MLPDGMETADALAKIADKRQLQGTPAEQLTELAGRICYDSLGTGRSSEDYHKHITDSGHTSVLGHYNVTVWNGHKISPCSLMGRPGVHIRDGFGVTCFTANLRALTEWPYWGNKAEDKVTYDLVNRTLAHVAPNIWKALPHYKPEVGPISPFTVIEPSTAEECWVSMYLSSSRGVSHEWIRHGHQSAISQRSTRYVDEAESTWVRHPLVKHVFEKVPTAAEVALGAGNHQDLGVEVADVARKHYVRVVKFLTKYLSEKGVDAHTARKQARGAARGYLGNALQTEMIFSASIAEWKHILLQRLHPAADAEIRAVAEDALGELKNSRYAHMFNGPEVVRMGHHFFVTNWTTTASPDGIGSVLAMTPASKG